MADKKLKWDQTGERLYETGTDHGVLYVQDSTGAYPLGVAWNGLTGFTESPSGADANAIYADNIKYLNLRAAEDYGGTITAYTYPDEFAECNGERMTGDGVFLGQQPRKAFGFSCRTIVGNDVDGDEYSEKIHLVYGATVSPSEKAFKTINDSPEAIEFSWEFKTVPSAAVPEGFKPTACLTIDVSKIKGDSAAEARLQDLKDALYGTDGNSATDPYLPTPEAVIGMLTAPSTP